MSKYTRIADLNRHVGQAAADRPSGHCWDCGYYFVANGHHRDNCTAVTEASSASAVARPRIFTEEKCIELGRCTYCQMHPVKQGHASDCDRPKTKANPR